MWQDDKPIQVGEFVQYRPADPKTDEIRVAWGGNDDPNFYLSPSHWYEVTKVDVHPQHTKVQVRGLPGVEFNSTHFWRPGRVVVDAPKSIDRPIGNPEDLSVLDGDPDITMHYTNLGHPGRIQVANVKLDDGRTVQLFVNRNSNLVILDVMDADDKGGVEVYRHVHNAKMVTKRRKS